MWTNSTKTRKYVQKPKAKQDYNSNSIRQRKKPRNSVQMAMLKEFLTDGLSAAGISHVVTSRSLSKRMLWVIALIIISGAMIYMTYNVLQEYLKYPTVMHMKVTYKRQMEFPAVTVCGFNMIPRHNIKEASLQYIEDAINVLKSLPLYNVSLHEKIRCLKDPLCRWSRFLDRCFCDKKVCSSTECYPYKNNTVCACSEAVCLPEVSAIADKCVLVKEDSSCVCKREFEYPKYTPESEDLGPDFLNAVELLNVSAEVKNLLRQIGNTSDNNYQNIERFIMPNIGVRDNYGIAYDNLILSCTFGGRPCNLSRDISTVYSPGYGKCYVFNYAGTEKPNVKPKIVNHSGRNNGLEMYLRSSKTNTLPFLAPQFGGRIVVHEPRSLPFAYSNGFEIRSGDMTSVRVTYQEINRLGPPWTDCAWDGDNTTSSYLEIPYDKSGCQRKCFNSYIFNECKCWYSRILTGTLIPIRKHVCRKEDEGCVKSFISSSWKKVKCRCPSPCREKSYAISISSGKINKDFFKVLKLARSLKMINGSLSVAEPEFKLGLMGLQIYYGSFAVFNTTESSIYSWDFFVANVGGNLGLFLGLSLVTFVEIAEFIMDISAVTFFSKRPVNRRKRAVCNHRKIRKHITLTNSVL